MLINHDPTKITHPYFNDPTNRWLDGLTNAQHHALPAISSSAVKYWHKKKSPWAFYQKYIAKQVTPVEFKPEFKMGTLIHLALLEPEKFDKYVFVCDEALNTNKYKDFRNGILNSFKLPELLKPVLHITTQLICNDAIPICENNLDSVLIKNDVYAEAKEQSDKIAVAKKKRAKRNKESGDRDLEKLAADDCITVEPLKNEIQITEFKASKNGGYIVGDEEVFIIKSHEMKMLRDIQKNAKEHTKYSLMLNNCAYIEQSGIARCPRTGLYLSCRGDARSDGGYFIDPKSANDVSLHGMESSQAYFLYFLQHAHYLYVANLIEPGKYDRFYFLYISKESPYEICFAHLDEESIKRSDALYLDILNKIAECEYKQKWPTSDNGNGVLISVPTWAFR